MSNFQKKANDLKSSYWCKVKSSSWIYPDFGVNSGHLQKEWEKLLEMYNYVKNLSSFFDGKFSTFVHFGRFKPALTPSFAKSWVKCESRGSSIVLHWGISGCETWLVGSALKRDWAIVKALKTENFEALISSKTEFWILYNKWVLKECLGSRSSDAGNNISHLWHKSKI